VRHTALLTYNAQLDPAEKGHKYVFFRAGAGGCCDCGDVEAWKAEGFCKRHRTCVAHDSAATAEERAIVDQVPLPLLTFVTDVACEALLHFRSERAEEPAAHEDETFLACLFNDEVHDMVTVQNAVQSAANCSAHEASKRMMAAHNYGHCVVLQGSEVPFCIFY
jgi:hypothetical protein